MSSVLGVSRSGFYKWLERGAPSKHVEDDLDQSIKDSFEESCQTYGSPRIAQDLANKGIKTSEPTVARRMNMLGISPKRPKRWGRMQEEISAIGAVQSIPRKGNCWDNAVAESSFKTIKTEWIDRHDFKNKHHAWCIIFEYMEAWYNTKRLHTALKGPTVHQAY